MSNQDQQDINRLLELQIELQKVQYKSLKRKMDFLIIFISGLFVFLFYILTRK